jgi:hypothetical protein
MSNNLFILYKMSSCVCIMHIVHVSLVLHESWLAVLYCTSSLRRSKCRVWAVLMRLILCRTIGCLCGHFSSLVCGKQYKRNLCLSVFIALLHVCCVCMCQIGLHIWRVLFLYCEECAFCVYMIGCELYLWVLGCLMCLVLGCKIGVLCLLPMYLLCMFFAMSGHEPVCAIHCTVCVWCVGCYRMHV